MKLPLSIILISFFAYCGDRGSSEFRLYRIEPPAQAKFSAADAAKHIGENATVCGVVASARYAEKSNRKPTFLNLDKPYPNHPFTAVIFEADRPKFGEPEKELNGKKICVSGKIEDFQGKPEIVLKEKSQLQVN